MEKVEMGIGCVIGEIKTFEGSGLKEVLQESYCSIWKSGKG